MRMVAACDATGVRLFVVKQNRHHATLQLLKQAVENIRFSRIYMVNLIVLWTHPDAYYHSAAWRGTSESDGGALMDQTSHYIDLIDCIIGAIEGLQAYTATLARDIEGEYTGVISLRWRCGAIGSVNVTMTTYPQNLEGSITVLGQYGTVRTGGAAVNEMQPWEFAKADLGDDQVVAIRYRSNHRCLGGIKCQSRRRGNKDTLFFYPNCRNNYSCRRNADLRRYRLFDLQFI